MLGLRNLSFDPSYFCLFCFKSSLGHLEAWFSGYVYGLVISSAPKELEVDSSTPIGARSPLSFPSPSHRGDQEKFSWKNVKNKKLLYIYIYIYIYIYEIKNAKKCAWLVFIECQLLFKSLV